MADDDGTPEECVPAKGRKRAWTENGRADAAAEMEFHSSLAFLVQASVAASIADLAAGSPRMS